jgi:hypothetical protein
MPDLRNTTTWGRRAAVWNEWGWWVNAQDGRRTSMLEIRGVGCIFAFRRQDPVTGRWDRTGGDGARIGFTTYPTVIAAKRAQLQNRLSWDRYPA